MMKFRTIKINRVIEISFNDENDLSFESEH